MIGRTRHSDNRYPENVPHFVVADYLWRVNMGFLRGDSLPDHHEYLRMIAAERGLTIEQVCRIPEETGEIPV